MRRAWGNTCAWPEFSLYLQRVVCLLWQTTHLPCFFVSNVLIMGRDQCAGVGKYHQETTPESNINVKPIFPVLGKSTGVWIEVIHGCKHYAHHSKDIDLRYCARALLWRNKRFAMQVLRFNALKTSVCHITKQLATPDNLYGPEHSDLGLRFLWNKVSVSKFPLSLGLGESQVIC